jgi:hypothetical protein
MVTSGKRQASRKIKSRLPPHLTLAGIASLLFLAA